MGTMHQSYDAIGKKPEPAICPGPMPTTGTEKKEPITILPAGDGKGAPVPPKDKTIEDMGKLQRMGVTCPDDGIPGDAKTRKLAALAIEVVGIGLSLLLGNPVPFGLSTAAAFVVYPTGKI